MAAHFSRFVVVAGLLILPIQSAFAQQGLQQLAQDQIAQAPQSARELRASLEAAKRQATETNGLDAAYELVGIADAAKSGQSADIGKEAMTLLNSVLERATQAAMTAPIEDAQDTLDQLVDLSFFTRTSNVAGADAVLQKSQRTLLPKLLNDARMALAVAKPSAEQWPKSLESLRLLGELQASANLVMFDDLAANAAQVYDAEANRLEALARQVGTEADRSKALAELAESRKIRSEQVADAKANNLNAVASEMAKPGRSKPRDEESAEVRGDMSEISLACTETGMIAPPSMSSNWEGLQDILPKLEEECVLSGRTPTENRCAVKSLSFICREDVNDKTERLSYVYQGTPDERAMQKNCKGERLSPGQLTALASSPFKNTAMRRIATCAPVATGRD